MPICNCFCTALAEFILRTIEEELEQELIFLISYDATKKGIRDIIDISDRLIDLFIRLCLQGDGELSARKRAAHFAFLTDEEYAGMIGVFKEAFKVE